MQFRGNSVTDHFSGYWHLTLSIREGFGKSCSSVRNENSTFKKSHHSHKGVVPCGYRIYPPTSSMGCTVVLSLWELMAAPSWASIFTGHVIRIYTAAACEGLTEPLCTNEIHFRDSVRKFGLLVFCGTEQDLSLKNRTRMVTLIQV